MNCEKSQNLISAYIDGDLDAPTAESLQTHFSICAECAKLHEDFASILDFCEDEFVEDSIPPNSQALWCRINNIIETEVKPEIIEEEKAREIKAQPTWISRLWNSQMQFSTSQMLTSFFGIALISSLLTIVGVKNFSGSSDALSENELQPTVFEKVLAKLGVAETPKQKIERRLLERKKSIDYWKKRVETRRVKWDTDTRQTFDRNLNVIEKSVNEYTEILQEDPQDQISNEMLDAALNDKMELLREFSEL
jgi:hypothetical protein